MSKAHNIKNDWEEDDTHDTQYEDENASGGGVKLNYNTLHVTNIPQGLTREGLKSVFSKYGAVNRTFLSPDPKKRFAIIAYQSASEAKLAMMKLNHTEPLKLNINISTSVRSDYKKSYEGRQADTRYGKQKDRGNIREDCDSVSSYGRRDQIQENMPNGDEYEEECEDLVMEPKMESHLDLELQKLELEQLKLQEAQVKCKQRMLLLNSKSKPIKSNTNSSMSRSLLPDGRIVVRNTKEMTDSELVAAGAGDSKGESVCSCKAKAKWWESPSSSDDGNSTPSTCILTEECQDKSDLTRRIDTREQNTRSQFSAKLTKVSCKSVASRGTDLTSKRSEYSKTDYVSKDSDMTSKRVGIRILANKHSDGTCEFKNSSLHSDSDDLVDETNRLIELRSMDYSDVVEDRLIVVVALAGYPKAKMKLQQKELFQNSLTDIMDMQLKAGLLNCIPTFIDYYLNRGAIVCICKDLETRDWIVRISPGLQERMSNNLILLKAKVKRLCLALIKIPHTCWPTSAQDAFKLLQYFNPKLRTNLWRIYSQKTVDNVECTSFLLDRVSGEIVRGPSFKNIIDYSQMEFELTGFSEIYYECLLSDMDEDLRSIASRVKLLEELRSNESTPRNTDMNEHETVTIGTKKDEQEKNVKDTESIGLETVEIVHLKAIENEARVIYSETSIDDIKNDHEISVQKDIVKKLKDLKYISDNDEVIIWSEEKNINELEQRSDINSKEIEDNNNDLTPDIEETKENLVSSLNISDYDESIYTSNETLMSRNSNINIDSNRGVAYYRRTNYLHVENELKIAITLTGYPQNKLEGTHIRRLKQLFKEYLHKDMKSQRFANMIIPKFQDVYLSNGAVIYICDSLETRDYLNEVLPKFINATGLKLVFRNVKDLVRYTRIVMRLPENLAHVDSADILKCLQYHYPSLKPDCWKYYSNIAGKQKRQFGVDPDSLDIIRSPDFDPIYEGEKISFRIIDRQKRDISVDEVMPKQSVTENIQETKLKDKIIKHMYCDIDPDALGAPLTRIRTNHYSDLVEDDLKLYVGPSNYPESRIDETLFHSIKRAFENVVFDTINEENLDSIPKIHDIYLFDGVIFIICKDMPSRKWIEDSLGFVNSMLQVSLKATEFRGAVGIVNMAVNTDKDTDEVIEILQKQNLRLRTKYWRKISTARTNGRLDVVLQIDKLSAQVINGKDFNKLIGKNAVQFTLGHLQSLLKPRSSLDEMLKTRNRRVTKSEVKTKKDTASQATDTIKCESTYNNNMMMMCQDSNYNEYVNRDKNNRIYCSDKDCQDPKIVNSDSPKSPKNKHNEMYEDYDNNKEDYCRLILHIPPGILPENKDDLNIIFDLLEDKNPGLNTELWEVTPDVNYKTGRFVLYIDRQSALVIRGNNFKPYLAGNKLKFMVKI